MAAVAEKRGGDPSLTGIGRNIFRSNHRCLSPMAQLKISPVQGPSVDDDLPSPTSSQTDHVEQEAYALARDYITYKVQGTSHATTDEAKRTLRRVGDEVVERHQTVFNAMSRRLQYSDPALDARRKFLMIAQEISKDGQENWGRIVSLFVLGGILADNDREKGSGQDIENIISIVGDYVGTQKRSFIERNGGWSGFVKFFDNGAAEEKKVWKGLLYAGLGIGAIAGLVSRQ